MAVTTITGGVQVQEGTIRSTETMTQSTATTPQSLSLFTDVSVLGAGTATGTAARNLYTLGSGNHEGQEKWIYMTATGEASVIFTQPSGRIWGSIAFGLASATDVDQSWASATGQYVMQAADDCLGVKWLNDAWTVFYSRGATLATTT